MFWTGVRWSISLGLLFCATLFLHAEFPQDANILNVRDFGAKGDGVTDDTNAINKAIAASGQSMGYSWWHDRIVYLPAGTYRISAPLLKRYESGNFGSGMLLIGDGADKTTLLLADHASEYDDPEKPRPMIFSTSQLLDRGGPYGGGKDYPHLGEGNDAYENFIESMTIDVGSGNPGAVAIDYLANNLGAIRHVRVKARAGSGATGIKMTRKWIGPAILEDVFVEGFAVGVDVANTEYGLTMDHVSLKGQSKSGLRNSRNSISAKDLIVVSGSSAIAVDNDAAAGLITLVRADLRGPSAIRNLGTMVFRDCRVSADEIQLEKLFGSERVNGVLEGMKHWQNRSPWSLPIEEIPEVVDGPVKTWVSVKQYGAISDPLHDSTDAFNRAFASGAATIYVPNGIYGISSSLTIPPTVKHIAGMNSALRLLPKARPTSFSPENGMIRVLESSTNALLIDRLGISNSDQQVGFEVVGDRDVVLRDIPSVGVNMLARPAGGGRVFLDNVCCGGLRIAGTKLVAARQFDTEGTGTRIVNAGSPLWVLGLKTERPNVILQQNAGAHTELMGGLIYMVLPNPNPVLPAFSVIDSELHASFAEEAFSDDRTFAFYLVAENHGVKTVIPRTRFPSRNGAASGRIVPLLSAGDNWQEKVSK